MDDKDNKDVFLEDEDNNEDEFKEDLRLEKEELKAFEEETDLEDAFHIEYTEENNQTENRNPAYYVENPYREGKEPRKRGLLSYFIVALAAALIGGLISAYIAPVYLWPNIYKGNELDNTEISITTKDDITAATAVAKKATKSVVGITIVETQTDSFWGPRQVQGIGSGVVVDSRGYILTNSHVIADGNAERITVQFENGDKKEAKVLWNDAALDLAIVKVNATNLPAVDLGDSDKLQIGELAIAIGNPLGLDFQRTVTSGIISGLNRTIRVDESNIIEDLIQTDASINPGNSGGPLLNGSGEVIGINTAKITTAEGLGFALPINMAKSIIDQVIREGQFKTVYMGIVGVEVAKYEKALGINLKAEQGVVIIEVTPDTPAEVAGISSGDVIISLDGKEIVSMNQLRKVMYNYKPGDKAVLGIIRNEQRKDLEIIFMESPDR